MGSDRAVCPRCERPSAWWGEVVESVADPASLCWGEGQFQCMSNTPDYRTRAHAAATGESDG